MILHFPDLHLSSRLSENCLHDALFYGFQYFKDVFCLQEMTMSTLQLLFFDLGYLIEVSSSSFRAPFVRQHFEESF